MEKLREEILQSESVRTDLLKWKLALVGAIGAAGLGFAGSKNLGHADLVLCAIPPLCVYVDLLCLHLNLKMLVIGTFLRQGTASGPADGLRDYEAFVEQARRMTGGGEAVRARGPHWPAWVRRIVLGRAGREPSAFDLEDWALSLSTLALSAALIGYATYVGIYVEARFSIPFAVSGVASLVATWIGNWQFAGRFEAVRALRLKTEPGQRGRTA
jgi:hypothetical protein